MILNNLKTRILFLQDCRGLPKISNIGGKCLAPTRSLLNRQRPFGDLYGKRCKMSLSSFCKLPPSSHYFSLSFLPTNQVRYNFTLISLIRSQWLRQVKELMADLVVAIQTSIFQRLTLISAVLISRGTIYNLTLVSILIFRWIHKKFKKYHLIKYAVDDDVIDILPLFRNLFFLLVWWCLHLDRRRR